MNEKELTNLAKEHSAKIISFSPFVARVAGREFTDECKFRDFCRDEVYAGVIRVFDEWGRAR